ncbi:MAG: magnesium transporter [Mariprofundaceae bacterium]
MLENQKRQNIEALSTDKLLKLAETNPEGLRTTLIGMRGSELGYVLLNCEKDRQRQLLFRHIPDELRGDALLELPETLQEDLLASLYPHEIETVVEHLDSDDAADILQSVDKAVAAVVIDQLEPEERREIEPLLEHDEESAGGLMQAELFKVREDWLADKVLSVLRRWGGDIEKLNYVYVVNNDDQLRGVLALQELLFCEPETSIMEIANAEFPKVYAGQDQEEVVRTFKEYDVLALPVVNEENILIGRITADDILDVVQEEATEDMYRLAALSEHDDLAESVGTTAWRRSIWLAVNMGTAILASLVIAQFEQTIAQLVALAILMPVVASMGGIAGTQTLTIIVRGIALNRITFENAKRAIIKEVIVGSITGLSFAIAMGVIASFWFEEIGAKLGLVIGLAMAINLLVAGFAGTLIPLTMRRMHIDPALASGTILTTVTDVVGFFTFLGLATVFLL